MTYAELLKKYIKESRYTLDEISKLLSERNLSASREHLSRLQNAKVPPASDDINKAISEITGGDPQKLMWAAYVEKAPEEIKGLLSNIEDPELVKAEQLIADNKNKILSVLKLLTDDEGYFYLEVRKDIFYFFMNHPLNINYSLHNPLSQFQIEQLRNFFESPEDYSDSEKKEFIDEFNEIFNYRTIKKALNSPYSDVFELLSPIENIANKYNYNNHLLDSDTFPVGTIVNYGGESFEINEDTSFGQLKTVLETKFPELDSPQTKYVYLKEKNSIVPVVQAGKKGASIENERMYLMFLTSAKRMLMFGSSEEIPEGIIKSALMEAFIALDVRIREVLLHAMKKFGATEELALDYLNELSIYGRLGNPLIKYLDYDIKSESFYPDLLDFIDMMRYITNGTSLKDATVTVAKEKVKTVEIALDAIDKIANQKGIA